VTTAPVPVRPTTVADGEGTVDHDPTFGAAF
jgi:hypothetical protein